MTSEQIAGVVRAIAAAIGGYFVGKGIIDGETVATIGGSLATIAAAVWSVWSKKPEEKSE